MIQKFSTLSTYSEIHHELSNDGYLTEQQFRWGNITGDLSAQTDLKNALDDASTIYLTDDSLQISGLKSDANILKVTHEKYQWYVNHYT